MGVGQHAMRQFVYISTARSGIGRSDIDDILASSQRNNQARELTGFLIYNGRNFLQLLEGSQEALTALMNRLAADPRHSGVVMLEDNAIDRRACADWSMTHIKLIDPVDDRMANLAETLPDNLDPNVRRTILNFASLN